MMTIDALEISKNLEQQDESNKINQEQSEKQKASAILETMGFTKVHIKRLVKYTYKEVLELEDEVVKISVLLGPNKLLRYLCNLKAQQLHVIDENVDREQEILNEQINYIKDNTLILISRALKDYDIALDRGNENKIPKSRHHAIASVRH